MSMMNSAMTLRVSEAELAADLHKILEKVRAGAEVVVEGEARLGVVMKLQPVERRASEIAAALRDTAPGASMDEDFARDVREARELYRGAWNPPEWE